MTCILWWSDDLKSQTSAIAVMVAIGVNERNRSHFIPITAQYRQDNIKYD